MIYKDAEKEGLPRHHFMRTFLTAVPLSAAVGTTSREFTPVLIDLLKHTINRADNPKRLVKLQTKGLLARLGKNTLKSIPNTALSAFVGGMILDDYLHKKLR